MKSFSLSSCIKSFLKYVYIYVISKNPTPSLGIDVNLESNNIDSIQIKIDAQPRMGGVDAFLSIKF